MIELLKFLLCKEHYHSLRSYVPRSSDPTVQKLYTLLDALQEHAQQDVTWDEYEMYVLANLPNVTKHDKTNIEIAQTLLSRAKEINISPEVAHTTLEQLRKRQAAFEAASVMLDFSEGRKSQEELSKVLESLSENDRPIEQQEFVTDDLELLYKESVQKPGLRWRLDALNKSIGSIRKGDFIFLAARPESGKSTFIASESTHMAEQAEGDIILVVNEEQGNKVRLRTYEAFFGLSMRDLIKDISKYKKIYQEGIGQRLKIFDSATTSKTDIERLLKASKNPSLLIVDQLDKVKGFDAEREDLLYGKIYIWARELAKQYCPVIGVCQASGDAEGKKWITMDNLAGSKTSKAAEADVIIGIGKTHDHNLEFVRHINIIKNKLLGDEDTDPALRHQKIDCIIRPEIGRYEDI